MPGPQASSIELTCKQREILERLVRRETSPQRLVRRCKIVLEAAKGVNNQQIGRGLNIQRGTVRTWRERWVDAAPGLLVAEGEGIDDKTLTELMEQVLADEPRPGAPGVFEAEQIAQIMAVACEDPQDSERPVTHWTPRELADEVIKREIVSSISPRSVGRFLKRSGYQASSEPILEERRA
ncbi:MAG: helix-turn-helix domain-containing protein [Anaerolineales bacterium]|nr:helix-turn-helix domain-containing protein [Anaerolineales bacterium]